jgi:hypothetical protein
LRVAARRPRTSGAGTPKVKDTLQDPQFKKEILSTAPPDPRGPIHLLYPSNGEIDEADLNKVTIQGDEAWEYRDDPNQWCIYMWEDPASSEQMTHVGSCVAD